MDGLGDLQANPNGSQSATASGPLKRTGGLPESLMATSQPFGARKGGLPGDGSSVLTRPASRYGRLVALLASPI